MSRNTGPILIPSSGVEGWCGPTIYIDTNREDGMALLKRLIARQQKSEYLILDSVEDFLERHGLGDIASEIRDPKDSEGDPIPDKTFYGVSSGAKKKGRLIQLLKQHDLWDIYVENYWPNHKPRTVNGYLRRAAEWLKSFRRRLGP